MKKKYTSIVNHYENCLEKHGDSHLGVDWPNQSDAEKRYKIMLGITDFFEKKTNTATTLLDFGCGAGHMLEYINKHNYTQLEYAGLDISEKFIALCKTKFPGKNFYCVDILEGKHQLPSFDFIILNGVFTEKRDMSFDEMWEYFCTMITKIFEIASGGIAFNVMSKAVDWEREDLFHLSTELLVEFLCKKITRNFIIRNDYGLYEYTTYIYK